MHLLWIESFLLFSRSSELVAFCVCKSWCMKRNIKHNPCCWYFKTCLFSTVTRSHTEWEINEDSPFISSVGDRQKIDYNHFQALHVNRNFLLINWNQMRHDFLSHLQLNSGTRLLVLSLINYVLNLAFI